ncbi:hypothetical protein CEXT_692741 [Caerostris extrusa]|uniref:Uncharacterized protein n=1 Tax=Caerostris extrusa TaxID=172846 RepID=A0AAV4R2V0_CAEEX|nr:hypothetical protein CEXT_692741 [Caerostris extrusa]
MLFRGIDSQGNSLEKPFNGLRTLKGSGILRPIFRSKTSKKNHAYLMHRFSEKKNEKINLVFLGFPSWAVAVTKFRLRRGSMTNLINCLKNATLFFVARRKRNIVRIRKLAFALLA